MKKYITILVMSWLLIGAITPPTYGQNQEEEKKTNILRIILGQTASRIGIRFPALENVGGPHVGVRNGQFYSEKNKIAVYNRTNHHILVLIRAKVLTWLAPNESATAERVWENLYSYEVPLMGFAYREKPIKTDKKIYIKDRNFIGIATQKFTLYGNDRKVFSWVIENNAIRPAKGQSPIVPEDITEAPVKGYLTNQKNKKAGGIPYSQNSSFGLQVGNNSTCTVEVNIETNERSAHGEIPANGFLFIPLRGEETGVVHFNFWEQKMIEQKMRSTDPNKRPRRVLQKQTKETIDRGFYEYKFDRNYNQSRVDQIVLEPQ